MRMKANRAASKIGRLMDHDPFAVIEGMTLAGYATGARTGIPVLALRIPGDQRTAGKRYRSSRRERPSGGGIFSAATLLSDCICGEGREPTSAARRLRCSTAWRASTPFPATARPIPLRTVLKACPPLSTMWKHCVRCRRFCGGALNGIRAWDWATMQAPR